MMHLPEDQDPLWDLLAKSPPPEPSPRFVARVRRAVRELPRHRGFLPLALATGSAARPRLAWGFAGAGLAAAAVLAIGLFLSQGPPAPSDAYAYAYAYDDLATDYDETFDPATEIEAVEHLAQLMAVIDPGSLSDELFADLFF